MSALTYELRMALGDDAFETSPTWTDVSQYLRLDRGVKVKRGRRGEFAKPQVGTATFTLDNSDGRFTPGYTSGAYYPDIKRRVRVQLKAYDGSQYSTLFTGWVDSWSPNWSGRVDTFNLCRVECIDVLGMLHHEPMPAPIAVAMVNEATDSGAMVFQMDDQDGVVREVQGKDVWLERIDTFHDSTVSTGVDSTVDCPYVQFGVDSLGGTSHYRLRGDLPDTEYEEWTVVALVGGLQESVDPGTDYDLPWLFRIDKHALGVLDGQLAEVEAPGKAGRAGTSGLQYVTDGTIQLVALSHDDTASAIVSTDYSGKTTSTASDSQHATVGRFEVGGNGLAGRVYAVAILPEQTITTYAATEWDRLKEGKDCFDGQDVATRAARVADWIGLPAGLRSFTSDPLADRPGKQPMRTTALAYFTALADTERVPLYSARDGALVLESREARWNPTAAWTLGGDDLAKAPQPTLSDRLLAQSGNDVTVKPAIGPAVRVVNETSVTEEGRYTTSSTMYGDEDEAHEAADYRSRQYVGTEVEWADIIVAAFTMDSVGNTRALLRSDVSDRGEVTGLPSESPATTLDFFIEGIEHDIGLAKHNVRLTTTPYPGDETPFIIGTDSLT